MSVNTRAVAWSVILALGVALSLAIIGTCAMGSGGSGLGGANVLQVTPGTQVRVIIGYKQQQGAEEEAYVQAHNGTIHHSLHLVPMIAATMPSEQIAALAEDPKVAFVEVDQIAQASTNTVPWGVHAIKADVVQTAVPPDTGLGVGVAEIDTGIDYTHPNLAPNYKGGYNFVNPNKTPMDDNGHGTHVAGIIAAARNNTGIVGVAPGAYLYALKALDATGSGYYSSIIAALQWCVDHSSTVQIASMSLGGTGGSTALQNACNAAYNAGVTVVAAAGNDGRTSTSRDTIEYPARYSSVIAVGAVDINDVRPYWSSTGAELAVVAPGVNIYSTWPGDKYATLSGTSMACPHVSGLAALVIAKGTQGPAAVCAKITTRTDHLGTAGFNVIYGWGFVDAVKAVAP